MLKLIKILFNIIIVTSTLILTLLWLRKNDLFILNRVKVIGNDIFTKDEIIELAGLDFSKEIFKVDPEEIESRIISKPLIKNATVSRYLPSAIKIKVEERDLIANASCSKLCALDCEGEIVYTEKFEALYDLPIITGTKFKTDSVGNKVIPQVMNEMISILKALRFINFQLYHEISEIHYDKNYGVILYLRKNVIPIIFGFNDYSRKISYLSAMYEVLYKRNELLTIKSIDVRFDGQVVVRN